jgi:Big-like domain-containing protein
MKRHLVIERISQRMSFVVGALGVLTALLASCGGGTMGPPPPRELVSLSVQPSNATATQGNTAPFSATGTFNQAPLVLDNLAAQWVSSDTSIATVDANTGAATCISVGGPVNITASTAGKGGMVSGSATLTCQISPNPLAVLSPTTLHLLCQFLGQGFGCQCGSGKATLTNTGGAPLNIQSIRGPSAPFSEFSDCPSSLETGQSCTINVSFNPTTNSSGFGFLDRVVIQDDAPDSPQGLGLQGTAGCHY